MLDALAAAERPLVIVGAGTRWDNAPALRRWLRAWGLAFGVTPKAKGIVDETDPAFVGVFGGMALDGLMLQALEASDLVVGFGFDPVEVDKTWHAAVPMLWILESPLATGRLPEGAQVVDHARFLAGLDGTPPPREWRDAFASVRDARREVWETPGRGLTPVAIVRAAAAAAPPGTMVTTDVGSHKFLFGQLWPSTEPGSFWMSNGLSGMGYGLPAAIAAKLARPERPVLAVLGDGGFAMTAAELDTARRAGAPVAVLVVNDRSLSLIRLGQESRRLPRAGVDFGDGIDCAVVAQGFGARGLKVQSPSELEAALRDALTASETVVVEVPLDPDLYRGIV